MEHTSYRCGKHWQEWLFHSRSGVRVGVTNYSGVGSRVGTGVGVNNFLGLDSGVDFLWSGFFCHSFCTPTGHPQLRVRILKEEKKNTRLFTISATLVHEKDKKKGLSCS
jgi:hypothetical protein